MMLKNIDWIKKIVSWSQGLLHRFLPKNKEELVHQLRQLKEASILNVETLGMLEGVLSFSEMKVRDIMLPKHQMTFLLETDAFEKILEVITESGHSRCPVYSEDKQEVIGILHAKDLLIYSAKASEFDLSSAVRKASVIPESKPLESLLSEFRRYRNHMAIVVDEYGRVSGFVTLEDLLEQIIGDIEDEFDIDEDAYIKIHSPLCYILKAHTPIEDFNEYMHSDFVDDEYDTIGGIVVSRFGYVPKRGEHIHFDGFLFKVLNADARNIKLLECIDERDAKTTAVD